MDEGVQRDPLRAVVGPTMDIEEERFEYEAKSSRLGGFGRFFRRSG